MYIKATHSTNTLLKELLAKGEWPEGERFLYTAFQTAGRGQAGNGWESEEGKNLLCSILLPPRKDLFYLNVLVSVAVHQVIRSVLCQAKPVCTLSGEAGLTIKWPNDIYYGDKKIAGILVENAILGSEVTYSIAGIGLNVNQTTFLSSAPNPVSLKQICGKETEIDALMQALMEEIEAVEAMDEAQVWAYYRDHLYRREGKWLFAEREVNLTPSRILTNHPKEAFEASIAGITEQGELVLHTAEGEKKYHFKEIQFVL
jgi:BirA family biotin operon repressor/biotin-[acetyl-CoA-carboxylase] ligase